MTKPSYIVGIDPGTNTGVGIYRITDRKVLIWATKNFITVQEYLINTFPNKDDVTLIVEVPRTMLYERNDTRIRKDELRIMYHAGGNRREALLLAAVLRHIGFRVIEVPPVPKKKMDSEKFAVLTRSMVRSNEHERDAVRLAVYYQDKA